MPLYSFEGIAPVVHPSAWITPTATLIGEVRVDAGASVWFGALLRGDLGAIRLRAGCTVQDNSVLHGGDVGPDATVGQLCVIHDCVIGARAVIGNGATVQDKAVIGARALVAAGSLIAPGTVVPDETVASGAPAKDFRALSEEARQWTGTSASRCAELARRHAASGRPVD